MKILVISHMYPSIQEAVSGGFVYDQVKLLLNIGHELTVISPRGYFPLVKNKISFEKKNDDKAEVSYINYLSMSNAGLIWADLVVAKKIEHTVDVNSFDLIYAHTLLPDGAAAIRLGRKFNKPVSVYVHGADVQKKSQKWYLERKLKRVLSHVDQVLVNSKKTKTKTDIVCGCKKSVIAPLGISDMEVYPKRINKQTRILCVGNLYKEKGVNFLIEAINSINKEGGNVFLDIVGNGPEKCKLEGLSKGSGNIKFWGFLSSTKVHQMMAEADIFALPSYNEAFGLVYIEALWQGTPIIGVRGEGVEDVFSYGDCGVLVQPQNKASVIAAIRSLTNKELRKSLGENGHRVVRDHYLLKNNIRYISSQLEELIK